MPLSLSPPELEFVPGPILTGYCRRLTRHLDYDLVIEKLSKHFGRVPEVGGFGFQERREKWLSRNSPFPGI